MAYTGWIWPLVGAPLLCPIGEKKRVPGVRIEKKGRV
jgi:hypothetical protein